LSEPYHEDVAAWANRMNLESGLETEAIAFFDFLVEIAE